MKVDIYVIGDIDTDCMMYVVNNETKKYVRFYIEEWETIYSRQVIVMLQLLGVEYFIINGRTSTLDKIINEYTYIDYDEITI